MNVFEFALNFEKEHKDFYQEQSQKNKNNSLKTVFDYLVKEEEKHEKIVKRLSEDERVEHIESDILPRAKEAFEKIAGNIDNEVIPAEQVDVYKKARDMEEKTHRFYKSRAEKSELAFVREAFEKLAAEEKKHETIMSNLVEFVNRPQTWLDNAEWFHLEDY
ncbi:MAG: ferritin-like domain-containing protein [Bacillota bacterium]